MSEYIEDYSDAAADQAEASGEIQSGPASLDSNAEPGEGESSQQESSTVDYGPQLREMYGRYGQVNERLDGFAAQLTDLTSAMKENASSGVGNKESIYDTMDANQRSAANDLVEQHPIVRELREFKDSVVDSGRAANEQQLAKNQEVLAQAIAGIKTDHGAKEAEFVAQELYQVAELAKWDLNHPYFASRVQSHIDRLSGEGKEKQQERQRATSERGGARSGGGRAPTAIRKSPSGKEYYSFQAAAEIAEEVASRNRTRKQ